jgi:hypothetical protein
METSKITKMETPKNIVCENREVIPWSSSFGIIPEIMPYLSKKIYTFNDVLKNETKTEYFTRKGLHANKEYLEFVLRKIIEEDNSLSLAFQFRDILPSEYGGYTEWALKVISSVNNSNIIKRRVINKNFTSLFTIETTLSKVKYFKKNPVDLKYLHDVFSIMYDPSNGFVVNEIMDDLIPIEFYKKTEWTDLTSENNKRRALYRKDESDKTKNKKLKQ